VDQLEVVLSRDRKLTSVIVYYIHFLQLALSLLEHESSSRSLLEHSTLSLGTNICSLESSAHSLEHLIWRVDRKVGRRNTTTTTTLEAALSSSLSPALSHFMKLAGASLSLSDI
jgi:hypothetical protein